MAKRAKKQTTVQQDKREYQSNVIQFSSVKKTRNGFMIVVGKNVIFLNQGLLDYISKKKAS